MIDVYPFDILIVHWIMEADSGSRFDVYPRGGEPPCRYTRRGASWRATVPRRARDGQAMVGLGSSTGSRIHVRLVKNQVMHLCTVDDHTCLGDSSVIEHDRTA